MEKMKKIANNLDLFAKTAYTVCSVFVWVLPICAVLLLIFGEKVIQPGSQTTITLGSLCFEFAEGYLPFNVIKIRMAVALLLIAGLLVFVCWFIRVIRDVIASMKEGKPFETGISAKLRRLSWIALIGGGVLSAVQMIGEIVLYRLYDLGSVFLNEKIVACTAEFKLDMTFAVVFAVLYLLSYVFRYGEELQQLSDETL